MDEAIIMLKEFGIKNQKLKYLALPEIEFD